MTRFLVFATVALMGVSLRFAPDWVWWADLLLILTTAFVAAVVPRKEAL